MRDGYREARRKYLPQAPASTLIIGVQLAEPEMMIEIEAVAVIPEKKSESHNILEALRGWYIKVKLLL